MTFLGVWKRLSDVKLIVLRRHGGNFPIGEISVQTTSDFSPLMLFDFWHETATDGTSRPPWHVSYDLLYSGLSMLCTEFETSLGLTYRELRYGEVLKLLKIPPFLNHQRSTVHTCLFPIIFFHFYSRLRLIRNRLQSL